MIAQQMASPAPAKPQAPPMAGRAPGPAAAPGASQASPALRIVMAAMKIIYSNPQGFLKLIRSAPNPTQGIVQATDIILKQIAQSAKGVPPETIKRLYPKVGQSVGPIIGRLLYELASAAGIIKGKSAGAPASAPPATRPPVAKPPAPY